MRPPACKPVSRSLDSLDAAGQEALQAGRLAALASFNEAGAGRWSATPRFNSSRRLPSPELLVASLASIGRSLPWTTRTTRPGRATPLPPCAKRSGLVPAPSRIGALSHCASCERLVGPAARQPKWTTGGRHRCRRARAGFPPRASVSAYVIRARTSEPDHLVSELGDDATCPVFGAGDRVLGLGGGRAARCGGRWESLD
jgi:hypothetical protein